MAREWWKTAPGTMFVIFLIDFSTKWHRSKGTFKKSSKYCKQMQTAHALESTASFKDHIRVTPSATNSSCTCILAVGFRRPQRYVMRSISAPLTKYLALQHAWSRTLFKTLARFLYFSVFGIWSSPHKRSLYIWLSGGFLHSGLVG